MSLVLLFWPNSESSNDTKTIRLRSGRIVAMASQGIAFINRVD